MVCEIILVSKISQSETKVNMLSKVRIREYLFVHFTNVDIQSINFLDADSAHVLVELQLWLQTCRYTVVGIPVVVAITTY